MRMGRKVTVTMTWEFYELCETSGAFNDHVLVARDGAPEGLLYGDDMAAQLQNLIHEEAEIMAEDLLSKVDAEWGTENGSDVTDEAAGTAPPSTTP